MLAAIACKTERPKIAWPRPIVLYADKRYIACHDASSGLGQWAGNNATGGAQDVRTADRQRVVAHFDRRAERSAGRRS